MPSYGVSPLFIINNEALFFNAISGSYATGSTINEAPNTKKVSQA